MKRSLTLFVCLLMLLPAAFAQVSPAHVLAGYWQDWGATTDSPPYISLRNIDSRYNVIEVAFATTGSDFATVSFAPNGQSASDFASDIAYLQGQGKKVLLSIGGQNGTLTLSSAAQKQSFISSLEAILDQYNFDGFDLDLEGGTTLVLDNGDNNFTSPTTAKVVNLISAAQTIISYRQGEGKTCWLTMAPETYYVQTAYGNSYGPLVGAYLPLIYGLRNQLTFVQPQLYNTGSVYGLDNKIYSQATPDFTVAMTEMLLTGFAINGISGGTQVFPALRPDQVVIGLPAVASAAPSGGYYAPSGVAQAVNYLLKGTSFGGSYTLRNPAGYSGLRGAMTWSINWDETGSYSYAANIYNLFFNGSSTGNQSPTVSLTSPTSGASFTAPATITLTASAADADGSVSKVAFYNGGTLLATVISSPYTYSWTNVAAGAYALTAVATDNSGASTTSSAVSITVNGSGGNTGTGNCSGVAAWSATQVYTGGMQAVYNNNLYTANYWTEGNEPDLNSGAAGSGQPWTLTSACGTSSSNQPPTVSLTAPAAGATYTAPASVTLTATAADADGSITNVAFYNGGALLGTSASSPYSYSWTNVAAGTYSLTAIATDNAGATTTSAAVTITVNSSGGSTGSGNCAGIPTYQPYPAVYNIGDEVVYNGHLYQSAANGLYNVTPGTADWWWTPLGACTSSSAVTINSKSAAATTGANALVLPLSVFPNPAAAGQTQIQIGSSSAEQLSIDLLPIAGSSSILHMQTAAAAQGTQLIPLDLSCVPKGIYIVKVAHGSNGKTETIKLIKL